KQKLLSKTILEQPPCLKRDEPHKIIGHENTGLALLAGDGQHAGAADGIMLESIQRGVRLVERKDLDLGPNGNFGSDLQKVNAILPGIVGHAADHPLVI